MRKLVKLPNGTDKTSFELCDEQYFFCTNYEVSTLGSESLMPDSETEIYMQMGYTGLDFMCRLVLSDKVRGIYQKYADAATTKRRIENQFYVIGNITELKAAPHSFASFTEAEEYLNGLSNSDQDSQLIVARLLYSESWH